MSSNYNIEKIQMIQSNNFGDAVSYDFICQLANKIIKKVDIMDDNPNERSLLSIGSVLRLCRKNSIIWGTGLISFNDVVGIDNGNWTDYSSKVYNAPAKILTVRGPLTRSKLISMGIECPESYGDPLILAPLVYGMNDIKIKYNIGIVPHYIDKSSESLGKLIDIIKTNNLSYNIINILTGDNRENINQFINNIKECEYIVSSSLHGVIMGIVYGKKTIFVPFSDNVIGNNFKFYDFFLSCGINYVITNVNENILNNVIQTNKPSLVKIGHNLIDTCPIIDSDRKKYLIDVWSNYVNSMIL